MKVINTVSEYMSHIEMFEPALPSQQYVGCFSFFRGQANKDWSLEPSLFRQGLFQGEQLLIQYLQHSCPDEFTTNRFETLVKLQHFGLPTRLLDTTTNPLVALFFACYSKEQMKYDGIVYVFPNLPVSWSNDPLIELLMDYVFYHGYYKINLEKLLNTIESISASNYSRLLPKTVHDLLHYLTIPALAVMPKKTNQRIFAQDGTFFLCGMKVASTSVGTNPGNRDATYYTFQPADLSDSKSILHKAKTIIIPSSSKEKILAQLDIMGINEAKLFPDLFHQSKHAVEYIKHNLSIISQWEKKS